MNADCAPRRFVSHRIATAIIVGLLFMSCSPVAFALDSLDALLPTPHLLRSRASDWNIDTATSARMEKIYQAAEPEYHRLKRELEEHTSNLKKLLGEDPHFNNHFDVDAIAERIKALLEVENRLKLYQVRVRVRLLSQLTAEQRQRARNHASETLEESRWRGAIAEGMLDTVLPTPFWLRSRAEELGIDSATRERMEQRYQGLEPRYHERKKRLEPLTERFLEGVLTDPLMEDTVLKRFAALLQGEAELKLFMAQVRSSLLSMLTAEQRRAAQALSAEKPTADWQKALADKVQQVRRLGEQLVAKGKSIADIESRLSVIQETLSDGRATEGGRQLSQLIDEMEERLKRATAAAAPGEQDDRDAPAAGKTSAGKKSAREKTAREKTLVGTVRDGTTGDPVAGASVYVLGVRGRTRTDRHGRYRLVRPDHAAPLTVVAYGDDQLYLPARQSLDAVGDSAETTVDLALPRGVAVLGRVVEMRTDRPIASEHRLGVHDVEPGPLVSGSASYYPLQGNRWMHELGDGLPEIPFESTQSNHVRTVLIDGNGEFRMAIPPGRGIILIRARPPTNGSKFNEVSRVPYLTVAGDVSGTAAVAAPTALSFPGFRSPISPDRFHAWKRVDPDETQTNLTLRFEVQPAPSFDVRFTDPEGRPVKGVNVVGLVPVSERGARRMITVNDSTTKVYRVNGDSPRKVVATTLDGKYGSAAQLRSQISETTAVPTEKPPLEIRLQRTASLAFRLVSASTGDPLVGYQSYFYYGKPSVSRYHLRATARQNRVTDEDGRVVLSGIVPGEPISLFFVPPTRESANSKLGIERAPEIEAPTELIGLILAAGEFQDLGDLKSMWYDGE